MCRLYGFRATEPTKVECGLVLAQNSLMTQSREDLGGSTHPDGWGIAYYENGEPTVERRATAAYEDLRFSVAAERVFARAVVAHVRSATVGGTIRANTHPYSYGPWSFAHNGTVVGFEELAPRLKEETLPELRSLRQGTNDSEATFYWMLSRLHAAGVELDRRSADAEATLDAFAQATADLTRRCEEALPERAPKLNFLVTDGRLMMASRLNRDLHWLERIGVHDCEICGTPHIQHGEGREYRAFVLASEPITGEPWQTVPEGSVISVSPEFEARVESFL
jgi:glutamine amidotransferase